MKSIIAKLSFLIITISISFCCGLFAAQSGGGNVKLKLITGTFDIWDSCGSHEWFPEAWGGTAPVVSTTTFSSRDCTKVYFNSGTYGFLRSNKFSNENWSSSGVTGFKADIYVVDNAAADVKFEIKSSSGSTVDSAYAYNLASNTWNDVQWNVTNVSTHAVQVIFTFEGLGGASPTTFYIDNLRLIRGTTDQWDDMDTPRVWETDFDAVTWSDFEPVTNIQASTTTPAGSLVLNWDSSLHANEQAELKATNIYENWGYCAKIAADFRCSSTQAAIELVFSDGSDAWAGVPATINVAAADTWETFVWELTGTGFNWNNVKIFIIRVHTDNDSTGTLYIDNIKIGK